MSKATYSFTIVQQMLRTARSSWIIWRELQKAIEGGNEYGPAVILSRDFFQALYHSQIHYVILILSDTYPSSEKPSSKRHGKTHSLRYLINQCTNEGKIDSQLEHVCFDALDKAQPLRAKIGQVRGEHFGHKLNSKTEAMVFEQVQLHTKDIERLFTVAFFILRKLAPCCNFNPALWRRLKPIIKEDTLKMMKAFKPSHYLRELLVDMRKKTGSPVNE